MKTFTQFVSESTKIQCPNCKEYPAWNKAVGLNDNSLFGKAIYKCGVCDHERSRQTRQNKVQKQIAADLKKMSEGTENNDKDHDNLSDKEVVAIVGMNAAKNIRNHQFSNHVGGDYTNRIKSDAASHWLTTTSKDNERRIQYQIDNRKASGKIHGATTFVRDHGQENAAGASGNPIWKKHRSTR
jgi:hypothetical protein